jgi:hypothetical protein
MPNIRLKRYNGAAWENVEVQTDWSQILNKPSTFTPTAHTHNGSDITSGKIDPERLGSGQRTATTFLNGLGNWETVNVGGTVNTTGDQTISGTKTFTDSIFLNGSINSDSGTIQVNVDSLNVDGGISTDGGVDVKGNIRLTGTPTTINRSRTIEFTGFDKEGTTDFSDNAYIRHTVNSGGLTGSVLEISSQNDAQDGINFITPTVDSFRHNGNIIVTGANIGAQTVSTASQLPTLYYGGQQLNPQTYFGQGVGVRVAMTGAAGVWADTLWINGYSGGDVLQMVALHTRRNGEPRVYASAQASNASSYGTMHEFLTSFNVGEYAVKTSGQSNWSSVGTIGNVVGLLAWKNYGNSHVIFDASNSTAPDGSSRNSANAQIPWSASYPTLMGWNGSATYGVRVDSARVADFSSTVANSTSSLVGGVKTRLAGNTLFITNNGNNA